MMSSLNLYGKNITKQRAVEKLVHVVPRQYKQVAITIDTLLDTADLSIEEVTGRLKAVDDDDEPSAPDQPILSAGKLYFTEEQWLAQSKQRQDGEGCSKPPKPGSVARIALVVGAKSSNARLQQKDGGLDDKKHRCRNCGHIGHWAKDYRKPKKAQPHLTQADEEDE